MVMYHFAIGLHIVHDNDIYINMCKSAKKYKINYSNSPTNKPLIVLDYWLKKIEKDLHLGNPGNIKLSDRYENVINAMVNHVNSMEQGMIVLQYKFIILNNKKRDKQYICIDELLCGFF